MASVGDIWNDEFFNDVVDTPKEATEQNKRVDKASNEIINKPYAEYKQRELNEKGEKTGKVIGKHVINLDSIGISRYLKIKDVKKLR